MNVKRRTRLNPLWTKRDVVDRIKTVDVRDYITTPFTTDITYSGYEFDLAAVVAAMEAGNGVCYIPPGDWRANAKNVALNDANLPAGRNGLQDKRKFTYRFTGAGKSSRVFFPLGMTTGDYLLIANSTNDTSSYHHHPKVICENFTVSGSGVMGTTNGSFIKLHQRSIKAKNMVLASLYNGFYSTGYADMTHAENISVEAQTAGGWAFTSVDVGDGHIYDQVHANVGENLINLRGAVGAQIRGCICGSYKIAYSDVSFVDCHLEGFKVEGDTTPKIQITASRVDIVSGAYFPTTAAPFIQIDDTGTNYYGTNLTIHEAARFITRLEGPASTYYALGGTALDIKTLSQGGSVRTKSAREGTYPSGGPSGGGAVADFQGIRVTASGYSALNTTLQSAAVRALLAGDTTIKFTGSYYEVLPTAGTVALRKGGTPTLAATAASQNFWSSNLTVGNTYYYAAHIIDAAGLKSALTAETSAAFTSGKGGVNLTYYMPTAPATLRIYRGTAAGTYTHWVDIPLALATGFFVDQGASIAGYTWNTGSVPTVPSASELVDGIHFTASGKKLFWAAAAPTVGTHAQGDYAINSAAATSSDAQGWICVSAGTPGTWVSSRADFASLTGTQTLSNKTLSYPKVNSIMDSNGNNALAVAATASAVNYLQARNQAAGSPPSLEAVGADTNISMYLTPKGTGGVGIYAATGQTPRISAAGADTNHHLNLQSKGTGVVQANGVEVVTLTGTQALTLKTLTSPKITPGNAPASASAAGAAGQVEWDSGYVYVCTAANTWKRAAVATW